MKHRLKIFIIYFPVILVGCQVAVNLLSFVSPKLYNELGFYLNTFFGTNVLFAVFLVLFTFLLRFCEVSRWAAIAELLFALNFLIVKQDNLYNIMFQIIVGIIAITLTFIYYIKKFPFCRLSLLTGFLGSVVASGCSCEKGLSRWENNIRAKLSKQHFSDARNRL
jgi:hypothetical protein